MFKSVAIIHQENLIRHIIVFEEGTNDYEITR